MTLSYRPNLLFICAQNKRRSRTAEHIFRNDSRFNVRSAGLGTASNRRLSHPDLQWADLVIVMEYKHRDKLLQQFPDVPSSIIEILNIPDDYAYIDEELIDLLNNGTDELLNRQYPDFA